MLLKLLTFVATEIHGFLRILWGVALFRMLRVGVKPRSEVAPFSFHIQVTDHLEQAWVGNSALTKHNARYDTKSSKVDSETKTPGTHAQGDQQ